MAKLTPLPLEDARALAANYGLSLAAVDAMAAGSVNSNFSLTTEDGSRYFARLYEEQDADGAVSELRLLEELTQLSIPTASPVRTRDDALLVEYAGRPFAVYRWVDGESLCQLRVEPSHCDKVGAALAAVHLASQRVTSLPSGRFGVEQLRARLARIQSEAPAFAQAARGIQQKLDEYESKRARLPEGLIHGDLFRDNVIWRGPDIVALIDFESASQGPFAYDLMVCIFAWCYTDRLEPRLVRSMLDGYRRVRQLSQLELGNLAVEGAFVALRFATTRITDFSMRVAPGETPIRDYRRFLDRLGALEAGALEPLIGA